MTLKTFYQKLKNCGPELSYLLAELFNMCLKEFCFLDCWKVSSVVAVFKNAWEKSTAKDCHLMKNIPTKNCHPVSLLSVVSKVFKNL